MKELLLAIKTNFPENRQSTRLFHGRGQKLKGFEFLAVDFFSPFLLITLYKEPSADFISSLHSELLLLPLEIEGIFLQKRYLARPTLEALSGELPKEARALEFGLSYQLKFSESQNIGFFLDMAVGRSRLLEVARDKKVLNLFSYTCSLSVAAIKGGAHSVVNIDMSKAALSVGKSNHHLNSLDLKRASFLPYDILKSWNNIIKRGPYDLIIIDPPTDQGTSFKVERDYHKIVKRLKHLMGEGAEVWACLNSPELSSSYLIELFKKEASELNYSKTLYGAFAPFEHSPESGLKIVIFTGHKPQDRL